MADWQSSTQAAEWAGAGETRCMRLAWRWLVSLGRSRSWQGRWLSKWGLFLAKEFHPGDLPSTTQGLHLLGTVQEVTVSQNEAAIMETDHEVITAVQNDRALSITAVKAFARSKCLQLLCRRNQIQTLH